MPSYSISSHLFFLRLIALANLAMFWWATMVSALPCTRSIGQRPFLTSFEGLNWMAFFGSANRSMPMPFLVVSTMALKAMTLNGRGE